MANGEESKTENYSRPLKNIMQRNEVEMKEIPEEFSEPNSHENFNLLNSFNPHTKTSIEKRKPALKSIQSRKKAEQCFSIV